MSSARAKYFSHLDAIVHSIPHKPGVYQFLDGKNKIIYVGKAKDLRKRVNSYFTKIHSISGKVQMLVRKISDIKYIVVNTEQDALLLENNLIKKYRPRYNVALKDDKTFPWIRIRNEPFPRVDYTRNVIRDGSQYFGPYANVRLMHMLLELIRQLYKLRNCTLKLTDRNIRDEKFKVCLEYHIGNCKGPCVGLQSSEDYDESIHSIREIIKGNLTSVARQLKNLMLDLAGKMEFEKAHLVKEKYLAPSYMLHVSDPQAARKVLDDNLRLQSIKIVEGSLSIVLSRKGDASEVAKLIIQEGIDLYEMKSVGTMEEVFERTSRGGGS